MNGSHKISALARIARELEADRPAPPWWRACSSVWASIAGPRIARPLRIPHGARLIAVGGATLGGTDKTGTAVAIASALARQGRRVALVSHAYRADPQRARWVCPTDSVREVGDDALWSARELERTSARVVVAPTRQQAVDLGADQAQWLVVDGLVQTAPVRAHRSLLLVDSERPWGNGSCPPVGNLRATPADLMLATDAVVPIIQTAPNGALGALPAAGRDGAAFCGGLAVPRADARWVVRTLLDWPRTLRSSSVSADALHGDRVGLLVAIARPHRVVQSLAASGVVPSVVWLYGDHEAPCVADLERRARRLGTKAPRVWLTTAKCATKLPAHIGAAPVLTLAHECLPSPELISWLVSDCASAPFSAAGAVVDCAPCELPAEK